MAATDPQRQLLTLIREFASEKSQGVKETKALQDLTRYPYKHYNVWNWLSGLGKVFGCAHVSSNIDMLYFLISMREKELDGISFLLQEKFLLSEDLEKMKVSSTMGGSFHGCFHGVLRSWSSVACYKEHNLIAFFPEPDRQAVKKVVTEVELRALEDILAHVASQTTKQEQEYIVEENIQNQVQQDHIDLQRKFSLMEDSERNKSIAGLNKISLQTLQCVCPLCYADNVEVLGGVLQSNEMNLAFIPTTLYK
ncbi:myosin [Salix suchowensis]|nr:myosin [Salix suchowensis]